MAFYSINEFKNGLKVMVDNAPAIKLYEKCGFQNEGVMRKSVFKKGQFVDQIMMSILKEEYSEK